MDIVSHPVPESGEGITEEEKPYSAEWLELLARGVLQPNPVLELDAEALSLLEVRGITAERVLDLGLDGLDLGCRVSM